MNPALPGGASGPEAVEDGRWSVAGRVGYTFVPYGRLQQGRDAAPNPNQLGIDVHLGTAQVRVSAETGTTLDVQLPFGSLRTRSLMGDRVDTGAGDLELRVRQSFGRWIRRPGLGLTAGVVLPTGPYVERSGAANLAPEAASLALGRGVVWWLIEADARLPLGGRLSLFAQVSGRGPFGRTRDEFAWGPELRMTAGAQVAAIPSRLSFLATSDVQWRGGASEPDPFAGGRLESANVGGWQWTLSPGAELRLPAGVALTAGVRIPVIADVVGNQLVPGLGAFLAISYTYRLGERRVPALAGRITVVDYWATWCAPCVEIDRRLQEASLRWPDVRIVRVDATHFTPEQLAARVPEATGLPALELYDARGSRRAVLLGEQAQRIVEEVEALRRESSDRKESP